MLLKRVFCAKITVPLPLLFWPWSIVQCFMASIAKGEKRFSLRKSNTVGSYGESALLTIHSSLSCLVVVWRSLPFLRAVSLRQTSLVPVWIHCSTIWWYCCPRTNMSVWLCSRAELCRYEVSSDHGMHRASTKWIQMKYFSQTCYVIYCIIQLVHVRSQEAIGGEVLSK